MCLRSLGLSHQFLRHVERTRVIVHLLDLGACFLEQRDLLADYDAIRQELSLYQPDLLDREEIVVLSKMDLVHDEAVLEQIESQLQSRGITPLRLSAATTTGTRELVRSMLLAVEKARQASEEADSNREKSDERSKS